MNKSINIVDKEYQLWIRRLCKRYRQSQIKAAIKVNEEMLRFYWELGRDIVALRIEKRWGEKVISRLAVDLKDSMPDMSGLTQRNIYYCKQFFLLYHSIMTILPQAGAKTTNGNMPQAGAKLQEGIFCVPWGITKY